MPTLIAPHHASTYDLIGDEMLEGRDAPSGGAGDMLTRSMVGKISAKSEK